MLRFETNFPLLHRICQDIYVNGYWNISEKISGAVMQRNDGQP